MSLVNFYIKRGISTCSACFGKRNFKKFSIFNKRGSRIFKELRKDPSFGSPIYKLGVRDVGYHDENGEFVTIPEKIPELIVPDLKDFKLKPYVSYRTPDFIQSDFTAEDLFNVVYASKISKDFKEGKLNEDGTSKEPSELEQLTPEAAKLKAEQTGTDLFTQKLEGSPPPLIY